MPTCVRCGVVELTKLGFNVQILDRVDEYNDDFEPTIWIKARIASEFSPDWFLHWVSSLVEPLHGDVVNAGFAYPPQASA